MEAVRFLLLLSREREKTFKINRVSNRGTESYINTTKMKKPNSHGKKPTKSEIESESFLFLKQKSLKKKKRSEQQLIVLIKMFLNDYDLVCGFFSIFIALFFSLCLCFSSHSFTEQCRNLT